VAQKGCDNLRSGKKDTATQKTSPILTLEVYKGPTKQQTAEEVQLRATQEDKSKRIMAEVALQRSCGGILNDHEKRHSLMQVWPEAGSRESLLLPASCCWSTCSQYSAICSACGWIYCLIGAIP